MYDHWSQCCMFISESNKGFPSTHSFQPLSLAGNILTSNTVEVSSLTLPAPSTHPTPEIHPFPLPPLHPHALQHMYYTKQGHLSTDLWS